MSSERVTLACVGGWTLVVTDQNGKVIGLTEIQKQRGWKKLPDLKYDRRICIKCSLAELFPEKFDVMVD